MKAAKPDVVVLCTGSSIDTVMPQIDEILEFRKPIIATTEELTYPDYTHLRQARRIHARAKKARAAVLATGVNPGFVMDALPIALTGVWELPKVSAEAWTQGAIVYWDGTSSVTVTNNTAGDLKRIGWAYAAADNPSSTGQVLLGGGADGY